MVDAGGGWVYFIQADGLERIKIGWTVHLETRFSSINGSSPVAIRCLGVILGRRPLERELHARFGPYRMRGEWFRAHEALLRYIEQHAKPYEGGPRPGRARSAHHDAIRPGKIEQARARLGLEQSEETPESSIAVIAKKTPAYRKALRNAHWLHAVEVGIYDPATGQVRRHTIGELARLWDVPKSTIRDGLKKARPARTPHA